jgi:CRISPR-associated protein Cas1
MSDTVYVIEPGAWLKKDGGSLKIVKGSTEIDRIPGSGLKRLILMGRVSMTSGVVEFLLKNRIETVFASSTGKFRARLGVDADSHVELRRNQYFRLSDPEFAAATARNIVAGKIASQAGLLARRARDYGSEALAEAAVRLKAVSPPSHGTSMEKIRGFEGLASRIYFTAFSELIRNEGFQFDGRNKRPPKDPVNAMLSYIYTVLTMDVLSAIQTAGLDPYLGTLHEIDWGRPSLACDLVEEFRTGISDSLVLGLVNRRAVTPEDFIFRDPSVKAWTDDEDMAKNRPVEMKPAARSRLMAAYETMVNSTVPVGTGTPKMRVRTLFIRQARAFAESLKADSEPYRPFEWPF